MEQFKLVRIEAPRSNILLYNVQTNRLVCVTDLAELKKAIDEGRAAVESLVITDDLMVRVKSKNEEKAQSEKESFINKQRLFNGAECRKMQVYKFGENKNTEVVYALKTNADKKKELVVLIPSDVLYTKLGLVHSIQREIWGRKRWMWESDLENNLTIKIVGGSGLISANGLIRGAHAYTIDLSCFDSSNVVDVSTFASYTHLNNLTLKDMNFGKTLKAYRMFANCRVDYLKLLNVNFKNVLNITEMFNETWLNTLVIENVHFENVIKYDNIGTGSHIHRADSHKANKNPEDFKFSFKGSTINISKDELAKGIGPRGSVDVGKTFNMYIGDTEKHIMKDAIKINPSFL